MTAIFHILHLGILGEIAEKELYEKLTNTKNETEEKSESETKTRPSTSALRKKVKIQVDGNIEDDNHEELIEQLKNPGK